MTSSGGVPDIGTSLYEFVFAIEILSWLNKIKECFGSLEEIFESLTPVNPST